MTILDRFRRIDPRIFQIASLGALLLYGMTVLQFDVTPGRATAIVATALATQFVASRLARLPRFDARSALISSLSLCLLLRSNELRWILLAAVIAISSKFLMRIHGKHVFNPTNLGIVALLLLTDRVWVSPGQWGSTAFFGFLFACLGTTTVVRAERSDVTFAFLAFWAALIVGRSLYLGEPLAIPLHRLESGALLLFAFFMISDPKTTPDSRAGRILFAFLVAFGAWWIQFRWFRTNGLLWSLAVFSMLVPLIDAVSRGSRYVWPRDRGPRGDSVHPRIPNPESGVVIPSVERGIWGMGGMEHVEICGFLTPQIVTNAVPSLPQIPRSTLGMTRYGVGPGTTVSTAFVP